MSALLAPLPSNLIVRPHPEPTPAQAPRNAIASHHDRCRVHHRSAAPCGAIAPGAAQRDRERLLPWDALDDFVATDCGPSPSHKPAAPGLSAGTLAKVTALVSAADGSQADSAESTSM